MEAFEDQEETYFNNDEDVEKERENVHQYFAQGGSDRVVAVKQIHKVYGTKMKKYVYYTYDDPKKSLNFFLLHAFSRCSKKANPKAKVAVQDVSFSVAKGQVFGLLGKSHDIIF